MARNAPSFGADPTKVIVSGHSAGGHLAVMALMAMGTPPDAPPGALKGAIALSGMFDLEPIRHTSINDDVRLDASDCEEFSPIRRIGEKGGPLLIAVGGAETEEFRRQSTDFSKAWRSHGYPCDLHLPPGLNHFTIAAELGRAKSALHGLCLDFVRSQQE